ncbi:MAG: ATP-binding protein [Gammaproteobacteria bacterium]|nr:ATP-binding protein [Gammaproteobacteria bacterium]
MSLDPQPLRAGVDIGQLENALINLAINARDAMPDGGRLRIRSLSLEMDPADPDHPEDLAQGRYQLIEVEDDGTGMPADCRERAFDPFFTTKEMGHGTGLGLSMVYGFIRQSGGDVRIDSEPDRAPGSSCTCRRCRRRRRGRQRPAAKKATVRDARRYRILVVEDDPNVRRLVTKMLDSLRMEHRTAGDGVQALRILDEDPSWNWCCRTW